MNWMTVKMEYTVVLLLLLLAHMSGCRNNDEVMVYCNEIEISSVDVYRPLDDRMQATPWQKSPLCFFYAK